MLTVSRAEAADTETIAALGATTFTETFGGLFVNHAQDLAAYLEATFSIDKIAASIGKPSNAFWLARLNGSPIGYAKLKLQSGHYAVAGNSAAQLQKIYVLKAHLGAGAGKPMQDAVFAYARNQGFDRLWLTVLESNDRALAFYLRNGWVSCEKDTHRIGGQTFVYDVLTASIPSNPIV